MRKGSLPSCPTTARRHRFRTGYSSDGPAEFHLLDRETEPTTTQRKILAGALNSRPNCQALAHIQTGVENYLHPDAISQAGGVEVGFGDFDDVAEIVARASFQSDESRSWESLSRRARRRLRDKAKKWLNREAVDCMTPERLAERDPGRRSDRLAADHRRAGSRRSRALRLIADFRQQTFCN